MANTVISDLEPPATLYRQTNVLPVIKWHVTASVNMKPGHAVYIKADDLVELADVDVAAPAKNLYGWVGWKAGQELDTAYASGESIPIILRQPGMQLPVFILDQGATLEAGQRLKLSTTAGNLTVCTDDHTTEESMGMLLETVVDDDLVAWVLVN